MGWLLEVYYGINRRARSALVKMEVGKLKTPLVKLAPLFYKDVSQEENRTGNADARMSECWR